MIQLLTKVTCWPFISLRKCRLAFRVPAAAPSKQLHVRDSIDEISPVSIYQSRTSMTKEASGQMGSVDRISRFDDVFRVFLILSSTFLAFERASGYPPVKGLLPTTDFGLILLATLSMIMWALGHVLAGRPLSGWLKLNGWMLWANQFGSLIVFSIWGPFLDFSHSVAMSPRHLSVLILVLAVGLTWCAVGKVHTQQLALSAMSLAFGLLAAAVTPCFLISP